MLLVYLFGTIALFFYDCGWLPRVGCARQASRVCREAGCLSEVVYSLFHGLYGFLSFFSS